MLASLAALMAAGAASQAQHTFTTWDCPPAQGIGTCVQGIEGTNVVGYLWDTNLAVHGFLYNGSTWTRLDDPLAGPGNTQGTWAHGISGGNIVGEYVDTNGGNYGFLYNGSTWTRLNDPLADPSAAAGGFQGTAALAVDGTNIVGTYVDSTGKVHAFLYNGTAYTTLDPPWAGSGAGFGWSGAFGISGTNIVGGAASAGGSDIGFLYNGSTYTKYSDPLGVRGTDLHAISGAAMAGTYVDASGNDHGFVCVIGAPPPYPILDDPLAGAAGTYPDGISGNTISGSYYDRSGHIHGFLATPTKLPLTVTRSGTSLTVSWPYPSMGWSLQQSPDLSTTNWTSIGGVSTDGTNNFITPILTPGNAFFRLNHQ